MTTGRLAQWHTPVIIVTVVNILSSSGQILMTLRIVVVNVRHILMDRIYRIARQERDKV